MNEHSRARRGALTLATFLSLCLAGCGDGGDDSGGNGAGGTLGSGASMNTGGSPSDGGSTAGSGSSDTGGSGPAGGAPGSADPTFPEPLRIATDGGVTCALDGTTARCWGTDELGQPLVLPSLPDAAAVSGGTTIGGLTGAGEPFVLITAGTEPIGWYELLWSEPVVHINSGLTFVEGGGASVWARGEPSGTEPELLIDGVWQWAFDCGVLRSDQTISCRPTDPEQLCGFAAEVFEPPSGTFQQLSANFNHACALAADATIACWGIGATAPTGEPGELCAGDDIDLSQGQTLAPTGPFRQVSAGYIHACAVRTDGTVACWGAGTTDDACDGPNADCGQSMPPPDADFLQVAAGFTHSCGLKESGKVVCWGSNTGGRSTPPAELQP